MRNCQGDFAECVKKIMPLCLGGTASCFGRLWVIYSLFVGVLRNNPVDSHGRYGIISLTLKPSHARRGRYEQGQPGPQARNAQAIGHIQRGGPRTVRSQGTC